MPVLALRPRERKAACPAAASVSRMETLAGRRSSWLSRRGLARRANNMLGFRVLLARRGVNPVCKRGDRGDARGHGARLPFNAAIEADWPCAICIIAPPCLLSPLLLGRGRVRRSNGGASNARTAKLLMQERREIDLEYGGTPPSRTAYSQQSF